MTLQKIDDFTGSPWSRQPNETDKSYLAFTCYRDLGYERSLAKAEVRYRAKLDINPKPLSDLPTPQIEQWSSKFLWVERVAAYDDWLDAQELAAHRRARVRSATRHAEQAAKVSEALMRPVNLYLERLNKIGAGLRPDELDDLSDEDLLRLGRYTAGLLVDMQRAEASAYRSTDDTQPKSEAVKVRGEVLRRVLSSGGGLSGMLEQVAFELVESPASAIPEAESGSPIPDATRYLVTGQDSPLTDDGPGNDE